MEGDFDPMSTYVAPQWLERWLIDLGLIGINEVNN